jgi:hypothetical protein
VDSLASRENKETLEGKVTKVKAVLLDRKERQALLEKTERTGKKETLEPLEIPVIKVPLEQVETTETLGTMVTMVLTEQLVTKDLQVNLEVLGSQVSKDPRE